MKVVIALILLLSPCLLIPTAEAKQVIRIEISEKYNSYSNKELRRRVWQLERAVYQLQNIVFELSEKPAPKESWTCIVTAFEKTFSATSTSKMKAKAEVKQKCAKQSHPMHCDEVSCGE